MPTYEVWPINSRGRHSQRTLKTMVTLWLQEDGSPSKWWMTVRGKRFACIWEEVFESCKDEITKADSLVFGNQQMQLTKAIENPRTIDYDIVNVRKQARALVDSMDWYGFCELSPITLWEKNKKQDLFCRRVQSWLFRLGCRSAESGEIRLQHKAKGQFLDYCSNLKLGEKPSKAELPKIWNKGWGWRIS